MPEGASRWPRCRRRPRSAARSRSSQNGDEITIDADARTLDLEVAEDELARRRERLGVPELPRARGYLSIYQRSVQPMSTGAVLVEND